ncbi:MAG: hypothetical protein ACK5LR_03335 [Mangrovibacterium sp.]
MYNFHSIKELLQALVLGKDLLAEMFGKRKSFDYRYDQAIEIIDENRVNALIEKGIIIRNGRFLEIEDQLLAFFSQVLEVNEVLSISLIDEQFQSLKENIDYYLVEDSEYRKYKYLKAIKALLRKMGGICLRNVVDLNRQIDNTFKTEPNYRIKIKKLENYDLRRIDIRNLIARSEYFLSDEELTFFALAKDEELNQISIELRLILGEARHNLIETEKQIINYINQVRQQSAIVEKIRQVKYLKDQFELESKSDIRTLLAHENPVAFEPRASFPVKLALDLLHEDESYALIQSLQQKAKHRTKVKSSLAAPINPSFFEDTEEVNIFIDLDKMKSNFSASGYHLLDFVMQYEYPRKVSFEEIVTCYCQMISLYEHDFRFTDSYVELHGTEFSVVYPG